MKNLQTLATELAASKMQLLVPSSMSAVKGGGKGTKKGTYGGYPNGCYPGGGALIVGAAIVGAGIAVVGGLIKNRPGCGY
jgi:hypothetical protein